MASKGVSRLDPEASRAKRLNNLTKSTQLLSDRGFAFEAKNNGQHLIVKSGSRIADFWPTTGQYCIRGTAQYKRGVFNLIKDLTMKGVHHGVKEC